MGKVYRHKYLYIPSKYIRHLSIRSPCKSLSPTKCYSLIEIFPHRDTPKPSLDKSTCCARPLYKFLPPIERATTTRRKVYAVLSHSMSPCAVDISKNIRSPPPPLFQKARQPAKLLIDRPSPLHWLRLPPLYTLGELIKRAIMLISPFSDISFIFPSTLWRPGLAAALSFRRPPLPRPRKSPGTFRAPLL